MISYNDSILENRFDIFIYFSLLIELGIFL